MDVLLIIRVEDRARWIAHSRVNTASVNSRYPCSDSVSARAAWRTTDRAHCALSVSSSSAASSVVLRSLSQWVSTYEMTAMTIETMETTNEIIEVLIHCVYRI